MTYDRFDGAGALPRPRRRFGQHFLKDQRVLSRIADALGETENSTVLEIGPGRGALTDLLIERAARVLAIEIDRDLAAHLRSRYAARSNVEIVEADVLDTVLADVAGGPYVLVGNVPYYITTPIIFHALRPPRPEFAVFLVQKEVALRMVASPGGKTYGALSVNLQVLCEVELLFDVPPGSFNPPPAVDSAVVRIRPLANALVEPAMEQAFVRFVRAAFGLRRKQLQRVVRTVAGVGSELATKILNDCALPAAARPETLSPADFVRLFSTLRQHHEAAP